MDAKASKQRLKKRQEGKKPGLTLPSVNLLTSTMRDVKIGLLIGIPAAVTILGIVWFLRRKFPKTKDDEQKKKKEEKPSTVRNHDSEQISNQPICFEEEGITLTQRKIPETEVHKRGHSSSEYGAPDTVAGPDSSDLKIDDNECNKLLTEGEREKVKEIVEAAIGAGLEQAKAEFQENKRSENAVEVQEEMTVQSVAPVQHSVNAKREIKNDNANSYHSGSNNWLSSPIIINSSHVDNQDQLDDFEFESIAPDGDLTLSNSHVSPVSSPQTASVSASSPAINTTTVQPSPKAELLCHKSSSVQEEPVSQSNYSQSSTLPSKDICSTQSEDALTAFSTDSTDLSSSLLSPSTNTTKDSVITDSVTSVSKADEQIESALSQSLCSSELTENDESTKVRHSSVEQQSKKPEESSANSNSPVCDNNSVGSSDSGRGGSEQDTSCQSSEALVHYDFNMPSELCGRLIGRHGKNINYIKSKSGASVSLTNNPLTAEYQICQVVGSQAEIDEALALIRGKFPLSENPRLTMTPITLTMPKQMEPAAVLVPDNMQLSLPEGASVEVYVSTIVDAGHVFVQQPTHRSFMSLEKLNYFLNSVYSQDESIPTLPTPVECGVICVCENEGSWYRAMVMTPEDEFGECQVKFVDYGGYAQFPISRIKQIRADFMNLPFQAVECFVANISPLQGEEFFSTEATMALSDMSQLKLLQCQVVARNELGTPYIHLYQVDAETHTATLVNRALVNTGLVRWVEIL